MVDCRAGSGERAVNPAFPPGAFLKKPLPNVLLKKQKDSDRLSGWRRCCALVDERDKRRCFVTGRPLSAGAVDPWLALERHHVQPRSLSKSQQNNVNNVVTVSRAVHQLLHAGVLLFLDKRGRRARTFDAIDSVQWDRSRVARGDEPCRSRKGLAVSERHVA